jgi:hypothetical protein
MIDADVRDYGSKGTGGFVKKAELRMNGPRQVMVQDVEEADGFPDRTTGQPTKELVLTFSDGTKFGLRAKVNRDAMAAVSGYRTSDWIRKTVELYFDPGVFNPRGGEPGGVRIRRPGAMQVEEPFVSDLEDEPVKGNGAERRPSVKAKVSRAKPAASEVDDDLAF